MYRINVRTETVHKLYREGSSYTECGIPTHGMWGYYIDHDGPSTCNAACRVNDPQRRGQYHSRQHMSQFKLDD